MQSWLGKVFIGFNPTRKSHSTQSLLSYQFTFTELQVLPLLHFCILFYPNTLSKKFNTTQKIQKCQALCHRTQAINLIQKKKFIHLWFKGIFSTVQNLRQENKSNAFSFTPPFAKKKKKKKKGNINQDVHLQSSVPSSLQCCPLRKNAEYL